MTNRRRIWRYKLKIWLKIINIAVMTIILKIFFIYSITEINNYSLNNRSINEILSNILILFSYSPEHIDYCTWIVCSDTTNKAIYQLCSAIIWHLRIIHLDSFNDTIFSTKYLSCTFDCLFNQSSHIITYSFRRAAYNFIDNLLISEDSY